MSSAGSPPVPVPDGFAAFHHHGPFAEQIGPFFQRRIDERRYDYGFRAEPRHCNAQDNIHGGALYSFADHLAGHAVVHATGRICATLKLKVEFAAAPPVGGWIDGSCEIYRETRTLAFLRIVLRSGPRIVLTADGCFRLFGEWNAGEDMTASPRPASEPDIIPDGYKSFRLQGTFPGIYGPMRYRKTADGRFVCGLATHRGHDNSTGVVHGGVLFSFADDLMGRAASATSRRYSSTIALDVSYLDAAPLGAWLEGQAEISGQDDDHCFIRAAVSHEGRPLLTADGVWRLFKRFDS